MMTGQLSVLHLTTQTVPLIWCTALFQSTQTLKLGRARQNTAINVFLWDAGTSLSFYKRSESSSLANTMDFYVLVAPYICFLWIIFI